MSVNSHNHLKIGSSSLNSILVGDFGIGVSGGDDYGPSSYTGFYNGLVPNYGGYIIYVHQNSRITAHAPKDDNECLYYLNRYGANAGNISEGLTWASSQSYLLVRSSEYSLSDLTGGPTPTPTPQPTATPTPTPTVSWPSGLSARYSADSYSGGSVLSDLSGNGFDMSLTNPVFVTSGANKYFTSNSSTFYSIPGNSTIYSSNFTWSVALDITSAPTNDWGSIFWSESGGKNLIIGYYGAWWNGSPAFAPRIDTPSGSHQSWNYGEGYTNQGPSPAACTANYSSNTPLSVLTVRKNGTTFEWFLNNDVIWTNTITNWNIPYINSPISFLSYATGYYATNANFTDVAMFGRSINNSELSDVVSLMAKNI